MIPTAVRACFTDREKAALCAGPPAEFSQTPPQGGAQSPLPHAGPAPSISSMPQAPLSPRCFHLRDATPVPRGQPAAGWQDHSYDTLETRRRHGGERSPASQADASSAEPPGRPGILAWVAHLFSSRSSQHRSRTGVSCTAGGFFTN